MIIVLKMIDTQTGEILAESSKSFVLNFHCSNDAGFACIKRWIESCVRGVRTTNHKNIELRTHFSEEKQIPFIPNFT